MKNSFYLLLSSTLVFGAASCEDPIIRIKRKTKLIGFNHRSKNT